MSVYTIWFTGPQFFKEFQTSSSFAALLYACNKKLSSPTNDDQDTDKEYQNFTHFFEVCVLYMEVASNLSKEADRENRKPEYKKMLDKIFKLTKVLEKGLEQILSTHSDEAYLFLDGCYKRNSEIIKSVNGTFDDALEKLGVISK